MANNQNNLDKTEKRSFLKRIFGWRFAFVLIILVIGAGYYFKIEEAKRSFAEKEVEEFNNIEAEIFDLGKNSVKRDGKNSKNVKGFGDLTIEDLKSDDDFLYQVLIQNQLDLRKLNSQMKFLEYELAKFKSQAKLQKMIITYVNLRELIFAGKNYKDQMQSFRLLSVGNKILTDDVRSLRELSKNFKNFKELDRDLAKTSRTLIAMKKNDPKGSFVEKLRFNVAKIVTVRKLDSQSGKVDGAIYRLQKALEAKDCEGSLGEVGRFDEKYRDAIAVFKADLESSCELRRVDDNIMLYLENLSLVN